jgi:hypothetical protein
VAGGICTILHIKGLGMGGQLRLLARQESPTASPGFSRSFVRRTSFFVARSVLSKAYKFLFFGEF